MKFSIFTAEKNHYILHGQVFIMDGFSGPVSFFPYIIEIRTFRMGDKNFI